ncbi:MAG: hypothetical protein P8164_14340 [Gammaproteobacteria bacterium]|jgi:hypothetical protein
MGGPTGGVNEEQSVPAMCRLVDGLDAEQYGRFLRYDGNEQSW